MLEIKSVMRLLRDAAAAPKRRLTTIGPNVNGKMKRTPAPPLLCPKSMSKARMKIAAEVIQSGWRRRVRTSGIWRECFSPKWGCVGSGTVQAKVFIF
jgi:hypothetical protein